MSRIPIVDGVQRSVLDGFAANRLGRIIALSLGLLSLVLLTLLANHPEVRFDRVAPALISLPDADRWPAEVQQWGAIELSRLPEGLALHVESGRGVLRWPLPAPKNFDTLRLVGIISVSQGSPQARPDQKARLIVHQPKAEKPRSRLVASWPEAVNHERFDRLVAIPDPALPLRIDLALTPLSGQLVLHRLSVAGLASRSWVGGLRGLLLSVWIGLVLWTGWRLTRSVVPRARVLLWAVLILLLVGILLPPEVQQWLEDWLSMLLPSGQHIDSELDVNMLGHFSLFASLAALLFWTRADLGWSRLLVLLAGLALATELMQLFIDGRQSDWRDVLVDLAGIGTGILLVGAIRISNNILAYHQAS